MSIISYNPPTYIELSESLIMLKNYILNDRDFCSNKQSGHISMAFELLAGVLNKMYKNTSYETLVKRSVNIKESELFSNAAKEFIGEIKWRYATANVVFFVLKRILLQTSVNHAFVDRLSILSANVVDQGELSNMLPSRYKNTTDENVRKRLSEYVQIVHSKTRNKSPMSIRQIIYFLLNSFFRVLDIDVETIQDNSPKFELTIEKIREMCGGTEIQRKLGWIKLFCNHIFNHKTDEKLFDLSEYTDKSVKAFRHTKGDNSDTHRISADELDALYNASKSEDSVRDELIFLLLITTGMRIGGLVNIVLEHVATINGSDVVIKNYGRTIEKGNKWFSFNLTPQVQSLLKIWISDERKAVNSPFLFSSSRGTSGHINTGTVRVMFSNMCKRAGLVGDHLHIHSLRHSFAHILLESGNNVEIVSKMLGHSSSQTTESYYLKENAVEVSKRANIPWLVPSKKVKIIPDFLLANNGGQVQAKHIAPSDRKEKFKRVRNQKLLEFLSQNEGQNQETVVVEKTLLS